MNTKRLVIIGFGSEETVRHFAAYLSACRQPYDIMDLDLIQEQCALSFTYRAGMLSIQINNKMYDLNQYHSFYCRHYFKPTKNGYLDELFNKLIFALTGWLRHTNKLVVNIPGTGSSNFSKLNHLTELSGYGFIIPHAFITNRPEIVKRVASVTGNWINKGCSSYRTKVETLTDAHLAELEQLYYCPSQFQELIRGYNVRVHVVGVNCIAVKIMSPDIDYRYSLSKNSYNEIAVPEKIGERCISYCRHENLNFAGFDFIVDEADCWYVLEVNPMPGYEFYDRNIGNRISALLKDLLIGGLCDAPPVLPEREAFIHGGRRKKFF